MKRYLAFIILLTLDAVVAVAQGMKPWQERFEALQEQIDKEALQAVERDVTRQSVINSLGYEEPLTPVKTVAQIREEGAKQVEETLKNELGEDPAVKIYKEATERFPLYKVGDRVTFPSLRPDEADIVGIIHQVDKNYIRVGQTRVRRADLPERFQNCTDETWVNEARNRFVKERMAGLKERQMLLKEKYSRYFIDGALEREGYVLESAVNPEAEVEEGKEIVPQVKRWITKEEVVQRVYEKKRTAAMARLRPEIEKKILMENGFKFYKTENKWLPTKGEGSPSFWVKFKNRND